MGMSSSQARLLNLTTRMHQIEYRAAKIEAEKLQLANKSRQVYLEYQNALEQTKIQYKTLTANAGITYTNATLKALENGIVETYSGNTSAEPLFLQNTQTNKLMLTKEVADKFGLTGEVETRTLDEFIHETTGYEKTAVVSYNKVANSVLSEPVDGVPLSFNPLTNKEGVPDTTKLADFANFNPAHASPPAGATALSDVNSITAGGNYTISTKEELQKLLALSNATNTKNTTFTLTNNISLSGIDWTGIKNFNGIFDGNGYVISDLTGTQGLFANTTDATVKNVGLENITITGNSTCVGGLIGRATSSSSRASTIENCYTTGNITNANTTAISSYYSSSFSVGTGGLIGQVFTGRGSVMTITNTSSTANVSGYDGVGGLIGTSSMDYSYTRLVIDGVYAVGNVSGHNSVGGLAGFMYNDQDNHNSGSYDSCTNPVYTGLSNAFAGGTVNSSGAKSGGFIGCYLYWGDIQDFCRIYNCNSTGKVHGNEDSSAFVGALYMKNYQQNDTNGNYLVHFEECGYIKETADTEAFGNVYNNTGTVRPLTEEQVERFKNASTGNAGFANLINPNGVPANEDLAINIIAALSKDQNIRYDYYKSSENSTNMYIRKALQFLSNFENTYEDNEKLYFLNQSIIDYLLEDKNPNIAQDLYDDIMNGTTTNTEKYYVGKSLSGINVARIAQPEGSADTAIINGHEPVDGVLEIPSIDDIKAQLYCQSYISGERFDENTVNEWIDLFDINKREDLFSLANINTAIQNNDKEKLNKIYNAITSETKISLTDDYDLIDWSLVISEENKSTRELDWDRSIPEIANAIAIWTLAQRGVEIIDDEQANSTEWLSNIINGNFAVFAEVKIESFTLLGQQTVENVLNMSDAEYAEALSIDYTTIATNTSLQEVEDTTNLHKAEAKYEADMRRIDMKDRKYDYDLAAIENERNAIKQEMETLKTVIKDNVERTFKLFG